MSRRKNGVAIYRRGNSLMLPLGQALLATPQNPLHLMNQRIMLLIELYWVCSFKSFEIKMTLLRKTFLPNWAGSKSNRNRV